MRQLALEEEGDGDAVEDFTPLIEPMFPAVVIVHDRVFSVTLPEAPREPHVAHCACDACRAANLAELRVRFR